MMKDLLLLSKSSAWKTYSLCGVVIALVNGSSKLPFETYKQNEITKTFTIIATGWYLSGQKETVLNEKVFEGD